MKITNKQLRQIIKEELELVLKEEQLDEGFKENILGLAAAAGIGFGAGSMNYQDQAPMQPEVTQQVVDSGVAKIDSSKAMDLKAQIVDKYESMTYFQRAERAAQEIQAAIDTGNAMEMEQVVSKHLKQIGDLRDNLDKYK